MPAEFTALAQAQSGENQLVKRRFAHRHGQHDGWRWSYGAWAEYFVRSLPKQRWDNCRRCFACTAALIKKRARCRGADREDASLPASAAWMRAELCPTSAFRQYSNN